MRAVPVKGEMMDLRAAHAQRRLGFWHTAFCTLQKFRVERRHSHVSWETSVGRARLEQLLPCEVPVLDHVINQPSTFRAQHTIGEHVKNVLRDRSCINVRNQVGVPSVIFQLLWLHAFRLAESSLCSFRRQLQCSGNVTVERIQRAPSERRTPAVTLLSVKRVRPIAAFIAGIDVAVRAKEVR
jgi:hypothetical protein